MVDRAAVNGDMCVFLHGSAIHGRGLFATKSFPPHDVISELQGEVLSTPNRRSVQIATDRHFYNRYIDYINHACTPSAYIRVGGDGSVGLVALKPITKEVDEITVNYNYSEYSLTNPFMCRCCREPSLIRGYRYVILEAKGRADLVDAYAAPYLRELAIAEFGAAATGSRPEA